MKNSVLVLVVVAAVIVAGVILAVTHYSTKSKPNTSTAGKTSFVSPSTAVNVAITGGTNGASCDSGGYFKPSDITIHSGESITFSVPENDPYAGGLQVNGLPGGNLIVPRGGATSTRAITKSVSFNGTWPNQTACKKGSGTITVK